MSTKTPQPPFYDQFLTPDGRVSASWNAWLSRQADITRPGNGTTAQRPTTGLYPGRMFFDTSLGANGKPIWVNKTGSGWVDATGASV